MNFKLIEPTCLNNYSKIIQEVKFHEIDKNGILKEEQNSFIEACVEYLGLINPRVINNENDDIWQQRIVYFNNSYPLEPIGITGWYRYPNDNKNIMWLAWFGIRNIYKNKGYGKNLLNQTIKIIKKEYKDIKWLYVYTDGAPIFYEKCQFEKLGISEDLIKNGQINKESVSSDYNIVFRKKIR